MIMSDLIQGNLLIVGKFDSQNSYKYSGVALRLKTLRYGSVHDLLFSLEESSFARVRSQKTLID